MNKLVLGLLLLGATSYAAPVTEAVEITKFYAPLGYDTNDNVQVTITGTFPSTCYYKGPYEVDKRGNQIHVRQLAYKYEGTKDFCIQMKVPYTNTIDLGFLEREIDFEIVDGDTRKKLGVLPIKQAPAPIENPDSEPYAQVEQVSVEKNRATGRNEIRLVIPLRNACHRLKLPIKVEVQKDRETILALPVVENLGQQADPKCPDAPMRLVQTVELPKDTLGLWLLHVRALGGQSFSQLTVLE